MMAPRLRWALAATLVATAAVALMPEEEAAGSEPVAPQRSERARADEPPWPAGPRATSTSALPSAVGWPDAGPASLRAWGGEPPAAASAARVAAVATPRPAPQPAPAAPAGAASGAAEAPAPPYTWIGRIDDGVEPQALLLGAQKTLLVRRGDTLDGRWQVQAVHPQGVTLLPLGPGQPLTLSLKPT